MLAPKYRVLFIVLVSVVVGVIISVKLPDNNSRRAIEWLNKARYVGDISLKSTVGEFNHNQWRDKWTIVLFGYLHCPDVCPTSLMELSQLVDELSTMEFTNKLNVLFVTVDPQRDRMAKLHQYMAYFNQRFVAATADKIMLSRLSQALKVRYSVAQAGDNYQVSHSTTLSLIDPQGNFVARIRANFDVKQLAKEISAFAL